MDTDERQRAQRLRLSLEIAHAEAALEQLQSQLYRLEAHSAGCAAPTTPPEQSASAPKRHYPLPIAAG